MKEHDKYCNLNFPATMNTEEDYCDCATRNPGASWAVKMGCTCEVSSNNEGNGFIWGDPDSPMFWINDSCPLHGGNH